MQRRTWGWGLLGLAIATGCGDAATGRDIDTPAGDRGDGGSVTDVAGAYARLAAYTAAGDYAIAVDIEILDEGPIDAIADLDVLEVVDVDQPYIAAWSARGVGPEDARARVYDIVLQEQAALPPALEFAQIFELAQVADPESDELASVASPDKQDDVPVGVHEFHSYSRYRVTLATATASIEYDAVALYHADLEAPLVMDPVLWMVNAAIRDPEPPASEAEVAAEASPEPAAADYDAAEAGKCQPSIEFSPRSKDVRSEDVGALEHISGGHSAKSEAFFSCECDADCTSSCVPLGTSTATETGTYIPIVGLGWRHTKTSARDDIRGVGLAGVGSQCVSRGGACVKSCLFGFFCDVTITFPYLLEVSVPELCFVEAKAAVQGSCPACVPKSDDTGGDDNGSGGDDNGDGGCVDPCDCCDAGEVCDDGMCVRDGCIGRSCGEDPYNPGRSCGGCDPNWECNPEGQCECTSIIFGGAGCNPGIDECGLPIEPEPCSPGQVCNEDGECVECVNSNDCGPSEACCEGDCIALGCC